MFEGKSDSEVYDLCFELIRKESDRGAALLAAMLAEHCLDLLLAARLLPPVGKEKLLAGFNSPIGTFSAKIELSHRLGCIPPGLANLLNGLKKIRNSFAHETVADFETPSIAHQTEAAFRTNPSHYQNFMEGWSVSLQASLRARGVDPEFNATQLKLRIRFNNYFSQTIMHLHASIRNCTRIEQVY